jgi:hypothetical protein
MALHCAGMVDDCYMYCCYFISELTLHFATRAVLAFKQGAGAKWSWAQLLAILQAFPNVGKKANQR